jgi:hypothetical protein
MRDLGCEMPQDSSRPHEQADLAEVLAGALDDS